MSGAELGQGFCASEAAAPARARIEKRRGGCWLGGLGRELGEKSGAVGVGEAVWVHVVNIDSEGQGHTVTGIRGLT